VKDVVRRRISLRAKSTRNTTIVTAMRISDCINSTDGSAEKNAERFSDREEKKFTGNRGK
jgi:hypothetical protein